MSKKWKKRICSVLIVLILVNMATPSLGAEQLPEITDEASEVEETNLVELEASSTEDENSEWTSIQEESLVQSDETTEEESITEESNLEENSTNENTTEIPVEEDSAVHTKDYFGTQELQLNLIGRYNSQAGFEKSGAEIVVFHPATNQAYIANGAYSAIDIVDLTNPYNLELPLKKRIHVLDLDLGAGFVIGDITSIAVHPHGDFIAFAVPAHPRTDNGRVVIATSNGDVLTHVEVGALPDMLTFTPDGNTILVANEGEPNDSYTIDPEGSVSIIDVTNGPNVTQEDVITVGFANLAPHQIDENVRVFGPSATVAQDFEPEYIVVSPDHQTAYVALQENNAIAELNLQTKQFTHVHGLGFKDHSLSENGLDASDKDNKVNIQPWPVLGMYQPDGIAMYHSQGNRYIVTANEGDSRDYSGFSEEKRAGSNAIKNNVALNADHYAGYTQEQLDELVANGLFQDSQLGRLRVTSELGKNDAGKYEALYSFGARSFSIWDASSMELVFDSGSDFEHIVLEHVGEQHFNANHTENTGETRSDDKGPEPEDVKIGHINGQTYAFVGLERVGGIMVYNITNPANPTFVTYYNSRDFTKAPANTEAGDLGTEGLMFISKEDSPTGKNLLLAANEVSGTLSIYEITYPGETVEEPQPFELTVMHTNDTHAHLHNVARRITAINSVRADAKNSLLLDAGDVFSGTLFFNQYLGQADLEFMNMAGYDAMVPGNHEFDKGPKVLADFIKGATFPFVSSNINYEQEPELRSLFIPEIGKPGEAGKMYPAIIKEIDGEKVGIFGLTTEDTAFISNPGDNIVFEDYIEKARQTVEMLENEGINKIIALTHLGYRFDIRLAEEVPGIDIIVGGHSHTTVDEPVVIEDHGEPTLVVQAKEYSEFLGRLDVQFDENGVLQHWDGKLLVVNDYDEDPVAAARLAELEEPIEELKRTVVGYTQVHLDGERGNVRSKETNLGNLITDGMLWKAQQSTQATIALQNSGGIRASINQGNITLGDVLTVMPFANNLVTLDMTGDEIREALENSVSRIDEGNGRFLQVSGLRFTFDRTKPVNERVGTIEVKTESGYTAIDPTALYVVATNAFLADGGDGFTVMKQAKEDGRMTELFIPDYDVFTEYLDTIGEVGVAYATVEGRIVEENDNSTPPGGSEPPLDNNPTPPGGSEPPVDNNPTPPGQGPSQPGNGDGNTPNPPGQGTKPNPPGEGKPTPPGQVVPKPVKNPGNGDNGPKLGNEKEETGSPKKGAKLPVTATTVYNFMLVGMLLFMMGACLYVSLRRKENMN
ncbi:choice-of-anchor I family protein [Bacillus alkalicellulosilyticus]|uniref:choice-of-anchor I family protein n=1 Tax=Alkalihalobacterium alkalicellulosilyticum TaxID=1912214 RepID=UPI0009978DE7|nr:choice-of-anchor I family protein [Bacillus alkalicellulosilyticus]